MSKVIKLKKKKDTKKNTKGKALFLVLCILIFLLIFSSPIFKIKHVNVQGNSRYSEEEIKNKIGINNKKNILLYYLSTGGQFKDIDPYIQHIQLRVKFPNQLIVDVLERRPVGYVPYMGTYLSIDKNGQVLAVVKEIEESIPVIEGLQFQSFTVGEVLNLENKKIFLIVQQLSQILQKYDLLSTIEGINIMDVSYIYLNTENIHVLLGNEDELDQKIEILQKIMEDLSDNEKGVLDLRDIHGPVVFKEYKNEEE